jgi:pimeloyl-ACP methyl ester carboxylesterase
MFLDNIYYEEFGDVNAPALLLIHGSTMTGHLDFCIESNMAERFAKRYRVIVPDCPGHGRSGMGEPFDYSFSRMAARLAQLLVKLHASPAFVIGHSNGGNVALYFAKEQPQHTRAAVLLAANAYIDDHVRKGVPVNMHPDRVWRERLPWATEMIELHDMHHGRGHWRTLLEGTITETITNPEWTKDDLKDVTVPCLCVQGENDGTNATGRHAQVLHEWLPRSELWIPAGAGHSVHHELPDEFEQRVNAFFDNTEKQRTLQKQ